MWSVPLPAYWIPGGLGWVSSLSSALVKSCLSTMNNDSLVWELWRLQRSKLGPARDVSVCQKDVAGLPTQAQGRWDAIKSI